MEWYFIFIVVAIPVVIWLQLYFSKFNNIWLGLILPNISFCISLIITVIDIMDRNSLNGKDNLTIVFQFLLINVFTVVLIAVFFVKKNKLDKIKQKQIDKMNIQDL